MPKTNSKIQITSHKLYMHIGTYKFDDFNMLLSVEHCKQTNFASW